MHTCRLSADRQFCKSSLRPLPTFATGLLPSSRRAMSVFAVPTPDEAKRGAMNAKQKQKAQKVKQSAKNKCVYI